MITITIPPDLEGLLVEKARRQGTTPETVAIADLRKLLIEGDETGARDASAVEGRTLYDLLADYIGTVEGTSEAVAENAETLFLDALLQKQRTGRL